MSELQKKVGELESAKKAVQFCLDHADGSCDMHGLSYWASEVERLRKEIKEML